MSQLQKLSLYFVPLVLLSLSALLASAQDNMSMGSKQSMSVTGCLKQGTDTGGYYLMAEDGKMYELTGGNLGPYVGHKVTVTGTQVTLPPEQEEKRAAAEEQEAGGATYVDMNVSSLKTISESCQ